MLTFQNCGPSKKTKTFDASQTRAGGDTTPNEEPLPDPVPTKPAIRYYTSLAIDIEETPGDCVDRTSRRCLWSGHVFCKKRGYVGGYSVYNRILQQGLVQVACFPKELAHYAEYSPASSPEIPNVDCLNRPLDLWCSHFLDRKCASDPLAESPEGVSVGAIGYNSETNVVPTLCLKTKALADKLKPKLQLSLSTSQLFSTCASPDLIAGNCVAQAGDYCKAAGMTFPLPISQYNAGNGLLELSCLKE